MNAARTFVLSAFQNKNNTHYGTVVTLSILIWPITENSIKFADFLDCAHAHMQVEKIPGEILRAFQVSPFVGRDKNNISLDTLRHLMCNWGEKLSHREFNALIKEMNINKPEISYDQFVQSLVSRK